MGDLEKKTDLTNNFDVLKIGPDEYQVFGKNFLDLEIYEMDKEGNLKELTESHIYLIN